jgi:hypothetical protein
MGFVKRARFELPPASLPFYSLLRFDLLSLVPTKSLSVGSPAIRTSAVPGRVHYGLFIHPQRNKRTQSTEAGLLGEQSPTVGPGHATHPSFILAFFPRCFAGVSFPLSR